MEANKNINQIMLGNVKFIKKFIRKNKEKINDRNSAGKTYLMAACQLGNIGLINFLIDAGADVGMYDQAGETALHYAVRRTPGVDKNYKDLVEVLLRSKGKNILQVNQPNNDGETPLHLASLDGHTNTVKFLLQQTGINGREVDNDGCTPLHLASYNGQTDTVKFLLQQTGINGREVDNDGGTPLHLASLNGQTDTVKFLLQQTGINGREVAIDGSTPLHLASFNGHTDTVKFLLQQTGINGREVDNDGRTPLHDASLYGHTDTVKFLLQQTGIDANAVDNDGDTPLHEAVQRQHYDVVSLMLSKDSVKLDLKNHQDITPFLRAVSIGHLGITQQLILHGADMNAVDNDDNNCLHLAVEIFHSEVEAVHILDECCTELKLGIENRLSGVVVASYLAHQGANFYHRNNKNVMPLDLIKKADLKEKLKTVFPPPQCMFCEVNEPLVEYKPCGHAVTCEECCPQKLPKHCPKCKRFVSSKSGFVGPKLLEKEVQMVAEPDVGPNLLEKEVHTVAEPDETPNLVEEVLKTSQNVESPKLEEMDLLRVAKRLGNNWWQVGILLRIKYNQLSIIKSNNSNDIQEQSFQMLHKWFTSCDPDKRTFKVLREALEEAECFDALECLPSDVN